MQPEKAPELSLDEQWIEWSKAVRPIFARHPRLEPLRFTIFKELLAGQRGANATNRFKHWVRPLRQREVSGPLEKADVLFVVETAREVFAGALLPVHEELKRRGVRSRLLSVAGPSLPIGETTLFRVPARRSAPRWAVGAWDELCDVTPGLRDKSLRAAYLNAAAMEEAARDEAERILKATGPRVVLSAATNLGGGARLTLAAQEFQMNTVLLQHGIAQAFYVPLLAQQTMAWGETSVDTLKNLGGDGTILPVGSPRHDVWRVGEPGAARAALCRALGLPERPTLVFFSNGNDLVRNGVAPVECAQWLEAAAAQTPEVNVVVRLHPNEDGALYKGCPHLRVSKSEVDLTTTLDGCDVAASLCSTVLYDALVFRKPVWQFYADGWPELADNWKQGLARRVASSGDLKELLYNLRGATPGALSDAAQETLVNRVFANHGRATKVIADFVEQQLQTKAGKQ